MLTSTDLDAPAKLLYWNAASVDDEPTGWSEGREFPTLREAIHLAMTEDPPAGKAPFIKAESGFTLRPEMLDGLFASFQGP